MSTGLLKIQGSAQSVHLRFPRTHYTGQTAAALLPSSTTKSYAASFRSVLSPNWDSFMVRSSGWCFTTFSSCSLEALEQRVSGPTARRARSPDLNPSHFYICGHQNLLFVLQKAATPTACNNEYRMGMRRFVRYRNFPASQAITVQMCNVLPQRSRWTLRALSLSSRGRNSETMLQKACVQTVTVSCICGVDSSLAYILRSPCVPSGSSQW